MPQAARSPDGRGAANQSKGIVLNQQIERVLSAALATMVTVVGRSPLGGGCIGRVERVDSSAGPFVVKWLADAPAGLFEAEAAGLNALRSAGSALMVPRVVSLDSTGAIAKGSKGPLLVLEYLPEHPPASHTYEQVGRGFAQLHRLSARAFGFDSATFCGATRQPNVWSSQWTAFYREQRLAHQIDMATDAGLVSPADRRVLDRVLERLEQLIEEPASSSLIHGDLWSGNLHITTGGAPAVLDPAVYFAHREAEFGMMTLFGGFPARVYEAYDEHFPLDHGWRERLPLYQLYHLLNHLNLFGAGYHGQVMAIARRFA